MYQAISRGITHQVPACNLGGLRIGDSGYVEGERSAWVHLPQTQSLLRVFVNDIGNADRRNDLQQIRCDTLEETSETFVLNSSLRHVHYSGICWGMQHRSLSL